LFHIRACSALKGLEGRNARERGVWAMRLGGEKVRMPRIRSGGWLDSMWEGEGERRTEKEG